jgi:plastocyanin
VPPPVSTRALGRDDDHAQARDGSLVTHLSPGTKRITVRDRASNHNFHLKGPGVDRRTGVAFTGRRYWTVTLSPGTYTYLCDVHPSTMRRTFNVP